MPGSLNVETEIAVDKGALLDLLFEHEDDNKRGTKFGQHRRPLPPF